MELHLWRTNYVRTLKTNRGCYTSQSKQTGGAILLRANKPGMLCFSEQKNGDAILLRANKRGMLFFSEQTNG